MFTSSNISNETFGTADYTKDESDGTAIRKARRLSSVSQFAKAFNKRRSITVSNIASTYSASSQQSSSTLSCDPVDTGPPLRSSPHPSKRILNRSQRKAAVTPTDGKIPVLPPRKESLIRPNTSSNLPRPIFISSSERTCFPPRVQSTLKSSPNVSVSNSGSRFVEDSGDLSEPTRASPNRTQLLPTPVQRYYEVKVQGNLKTSPTRTPSKSRLSYDVVHRQLMQPVVTCKTPCLSTLASPQITKFEAQRCAVIYSGRSRTNTTESQNPKDGGKSAISILKSSLQGLSNLASKSVVSSSERSGSPPCDVVHDSQPQSFWVGRYISLNDRFRSEKLDPKRLAKSQERYSKYEEDEVARTKRVFRQLHKLCASQEAKTSLKEFESHFALMNAMPELLQKSSPRAYKVTLGNGNVTGGTGRSSGYGLVPDASVTALPNLGCAVKRSRRRGGSEVSLASQSSGLARKASWVVDKILGKKTTSDLTEEAAPLNAGASGLEISDS